MHKNTGTWTASVRAIAFYKKHGFRLVEPKTEKDRLLRLYWFGDAAGMVLVPPPR
jgi:hypothetical protein